MGIQKREIVKCIIFSIITCGIYGFYWFVKLNDDTNALAGEQSTPGTTALILYIVTCGIYGYYWAYKQGEKLESVRASKGMQSGSLPILYIVLMFVMPIAAFALMQNEINTVA